jgi:hypothetical protein
MTNEQSEKTTPGSLARALVDLRDRTVQKSRIQWGNRLAAIDRGDDDPTYRYIVDKWLGHFIELEKDLDGALLDLADDMPIIDLMVRVKGVGPTLAIKVASMIDISRARHVSSLWKYAGYGVTDGERDRLKKGETSPYNTRLKTACYLVGSSMLKCNSPYRAIYDEAKKFYLNNRDWTKGHCHLAAMRKMIKVWLSHLWLVWREMEGLETNEPYICAKEPQHNYIPPNRFGWYDSQ